MPRRSAEDLQAEIDRAYEMLCIFEDYRKLHFSNDPDDQGRFLPDKEDWITSLRAEGVTWSQILQGYEQALNDTLVVFSMSGPDVDAYGAGLRAYFRDRTGKDLFSVITPPMRKLKAIAKRGRIKNETEYYLVKEFTDNLSDDPKLIDLARSLDTCLSRFEPDTQE